MKQLKPIRKLAVHRETLRALARDELVVIVGGDTPASSNVAGCVVQNFAPKP